MQLSTVQDPKFMTDKILVAETDTFVKKERDLLNRILHCFAEIERRRLFSELGYKSLIDMAIKRYGYSADQAWRRVHAMRLLKTMPEIEEKIADGSLNLTHLGMAQTLFKQEACTHEQKQVIIEKIAKTSTREAEKIILSHSSSPKTFWPDRTRTVSEDLVEIKFTAKSSLAEKAEILRGLLAHSKPNAKMSDLVEKAFDHLIADLSKKKDIRHISSEDPSLPQNSLPLSCSMCQSTYALEIDHIHPKAVGGTDDPENLRRLCRSCNQRAAIRFFGARKMQAHLEKT